MTTFALTKGDAQKLAVVIRCGLNAIQQDTHTRDVATAVANKLSSSDGAVVIETDRGDMQVFA